MIAPPRQRSGVCDRHCDRTRQRPARRADPQSAARVLEPQARAIGMGIFYTLYYATMMLGPVVAGVPAKWIGCAGAGIDFGAASLLACPALLLAFNRLPKARPKMT
jgi:hypothetical protein